MEEETRRGKRKEGRRMEEKMRQAWKMGTKEGVKKKWKGDIALQKMRKRRKWNKESGR